jgi:hypothetical protein
MDYHIARNQEKLGVYSEDEVRARIQSGELRPTDLAWCEGMPAWRPVGEVFAISPTPPPVPGPAVQAPSPSVPVSPTVKPSNHLIWAILATLFCCLPFGIVSIVYASQVDSKFHSGDIAGAEKASKRALTWVWVSLGAGVLGSILWVVVMFAFGSLGALSGAGLPGQ